MSSHILNTLNDFWWTVGQIVSKVSTVALEPQEPLLYLDGGTGFLFAGLRIASKTKASVLTSRHRKRSFIIIYWQSVCHHIKIQCCHPGRGEVRAQQKYVHSDLNEYFLSLALFQHCTTDIHSDLTCLSHDKLPLHSNGLYPSEMLTAVGWLETLNTNSDTDFKSLFLKLKLWRLTRSEKLKGSMYSMSLLYRFRFSRTYKPEKNDRPYKECVASLIGP